MVLRTSSFGSILFLSEEAYFLRERERENLIHHLVTFFSPNYFQTFAFKIKREANNAVSNRLERSKVNI